MFGWHRHKWKYIGADAFLSYTVFMLECGVCQKRKTKEFPGCWKMAEEEKPKDYELQQLRKLVELE
jgi:hypothetical protein